jgi:quinol monooxygenase YgiN/putative flippase GtrA
LTDSRIAARRTALQLLKFTLLSISAGLIQTAAFTALSELTPLPYWPCYLAALALSVAYNFTANRKFTFKQAANVPAAMLKIGIYYLFFTPLSVWGGHRLTDAGANEYAVLAGSLFANFITEFLVYKYAVFRAKPSDTNNFNNKSGDFTMANIHVIAESYVRADAADAYLALAKQIVEKTNALDKGCVSYRLVRDKADPRHFAMIEEWTDQASLDAHMASAHFVEIIPQMGALSDTSREGGIALFDPAF